MNAGDVDAGQEWTRRHDMPFRRNKVKGERGVAGFGEGFAYRQMVEEVIGDYFDLVDNSAHLVQSVMPDGRFFYVNRRWRELLGYGIEEVAEMRFLDAIHPDSRPHCFDLFQEMASGRCPIEKVELDFIARDGERVMAKGEVACRVEKGKMLATRGVFSPVREGADAAPRVEGEPFEADELFLEFKDLIA